VRFSKRANDANGGSDGGAQAGVTSSAVADAADPPVLAPPPRLPLGRLLVEAGITDDVGVDDAVREGQETGERLGEVVIRRGWANDEQIAQLLARQWQLPCIPRSAMVFDPDVLPQLSREQALELEAIPMRVENERVVVAVAEPTEARLEAIRRLVGDDAALTVVPTAALNAALNSDLLFPGAQPSDAPAAAPATVALVPDGLQEAEPQPESDRPLPLEPEGPPVGLARIESHAAAADDAVIASLETAQGHMTAATSALAALAESVAARAHEFARLQKQVEASEAARKDDATTIETLREELAERSRTAAAAHKKLLELTEIVAANAADT
jgi:Type II secretion system (T2SS), protein E, N-terminal domain